MASYPNSIWAPTTKNTNDVIQPAHINDAQSEIVALESDLLATSWTSYTPALASLTIGNGSLQGSYMRLKNIVFFRALIIFGTTTSVTGSVWIGTPTSFVMTAAGDHLGHGTAYDSSATQIYPMMVIPAAASMIALMSVANPLAAVTATVPFTFAVSDQLGVAGWYIQN
jgi:hypothetical protein